jgi:hypothetical protein
LDASTLSARRELMLARNDAPGFIDLGRSGRAFLLSDRLVVLCDGGIVGIHTRRNGFLRIGYLMTDRAKSAA